MIRAVFVCCVQNLSTLGGVTVRQMEMVKWLWQTRCWHISFHHEVMYNDKGGKFSGKPRVRDGL